MLAHPSTVLLCTANPLRIRQVLLPTGGQFVSHEQFLADDPDRQAVQVRCDFCFPRFREGNRRDGSQQINPVGRTAQLNDGIRFAEIVRFESRKAKVIDGGGNERGVFRRGFNEKIIVLGNLNREAK